MKHISLTDDLYDYLLSVSLREDPALHALRQHTAGHMLAHMQAAPEVAQFLQLLLKLISAKRVLEIGTFTGYSALAMALVLPDDGELITCDLNAEWTKDAPTFWEQAGQQHKIKLRLAPALETLEALIKEGYQQTFDFIFIDADKTNYKNYYELALQLIHPKGLIVIDNVLWYGRVVDPQDISAQTREIRRLNDWIKQDKRVDVSLLPVGDGLFLVKPHEKEFLNEERITER